MVSVEVIVGLGTVVATFAIAGATFATLRRDIRHRLRARHTDDIREQVLEPWLDNLPSYRASTPRGPDGGSESLLDSMAGHGFKPYPDEVSETLKDHFLEYHLSDDAPADLNSLLDEMEESILAIRNEKKAYLDDVVESPEMEEMLSTINKSWAEVDPQQLAIWLREVYVAEYTGGHLQGEVLWWDPDRIQNGLKVKERDGEYRYYTLSEKKRERHQITNRPIITSDTEVPELEVEKLLHEYKKHGEYDFGKGDHNEHIRNAGEAMTDLISNQYCDLEQTLEYYGAKPILPNDCYHSQ